MASKKTNIIHYKIRNGVNISTHNNKFISNLIKKEEKKNYGSVFA